MQSSASLAELQNGIGKMDISPTENGAGADSLHGRTVTGVLSSRPTSRDIKIDGFSMGLNGNELIQDCSIEITIGRRYGLIGQNGCGKTNFLQCLANREVGLAVLFRPTHFDSYSITLIPWRRNHMRKNSGEWDSPAARQASLGHSLGQ